MPQAASRDDIYRRRRYSPELRAGLVSRSAHRSHPRRSRPGGNPSQMPRVSVTVAARLVDFVSTRERLHRESLGRDFITAT